MRQPFSGGHESLANQEIAPLEVAPRSEPGPVPERSAKPSTWRVCRLGQRAIRAVRRRSDRDAVARAKHSHLLEQLTSDAHAPFKRLATESPEVYSYSQQEVVTPLVNGRTGSARTHWWIVLGASLLLLIASPISSGGLHQFRRSPPVAPVRDRRSSSARRSAPTAVCANGCLKCRRGRRRRIRWSSDRAPGDSLHRPMASRRPSAIVGNGFAPDFLQFRARSSGLC